MLDSKHFVACLFAVFLWVVAVKTVLCNERSHSFCRRLNLCLFIEGVFALDLLKVVERWAALTEGRKLFTFFLEIKENKPLQVYDIEQLHRAFSLDMFHTSQRNAIPLVPPEPTAAGRTESCVGELSANQTCFLIVELQTTWCCSASVKIFPFDSQEQIVTPAVEL